MQRSFNSVTITAICFALILAVLCILPLYATAQILPANTPAASGIDPNKQSSERNHHIAGIFLIAIGLSVIWSKRDGSRAWQRCLPPVLFIAAGLFLAAWSDAEIWPRGNLSWTWLSHDAEALQHKFYAVLLIVFGLAEYVQSTPTLRRPWLRMATPVLCVIGGASLFLHHHGSMAVVNANGMDHSGHNVAVAQDVNSGCPSGSDAAPADPESHHHHHNAAEHGAPDPSHPCPSTLAHADHASMAEGHDHAHAMMGVGASIQRQHAWFAIVGFCVALFKFLHDFARPPLRVSHSLWANSVIALGVLLLIYVE